MKKAFRAIEKTHAIADYVLTKIDKVEIYVKNIAKGELPDDAFSLPEDFEKVSAIEELKEKFLEPESSGGGWT